MERPEPTTELILEVTGGNSYLLSCTHHGLYETPLHGFSTNLNVDEKIVFPAISWLSRKDDLTSVKDLVQSGDIYKIFNYFNSIGFPWLNKNKAISEELKPLYEQLNPYKGRNLEARLQRVGPEAVQNLMGKLKKEVDSYPSKKPDELAAEISEMFSDYSWEYEPLTATKTKISQIQPPLL